TSGGIPVTAYWSITDNHCIVPTPGVRSVLLTKALTKHEPHDGPRKTGYVNFGVLCGDGYFDYFDRTFANSLTVQANISGYAAPFFTWQIDGQPVPMLGGAITVPAQWEPEPRVTKLIPAPAKPDTATLSTFSPGQGVGYLTIDVGPDAGNTSFRLTVS